MIYTCTRRRSIKRLLALMFFLAGLLAWVALLPGQAELAIAQTARPSWTYTGTLNRTRADTATLLPKGAR